MSIRSNKFFADVCKALLVAGLLLAPAAGLADEPRLGTCLKNKAVCFAPSASVFLTQVDLSTGEFSGGVDAGIGYGVRYRRDNLTVGVSLYAESEFARDPKSIRASLVASFMEYVRVGVGLSVLDGESVHPIIQFGVGADLMTGK